MRSPDAWVRIAAPRPEARLRLFAFPYAGAGASLFRPWREHLPDHVELCAVQLPGREDRMREPALTDMTQLVAELGRVLEPRLDRDYAFYGHSMGALVGFELARALRRRGGRAPRALLVSGRLAPHLVPATPALHALPDAEALAMLRRVGGVSPAFLERPKWVQTFLPIVRADMQLCETHVHVAEEPLDCPIAVYGGRDDPVVSRAELEGWRVHTRGGFSLEQLPGGHFLPQSHREPLLRALSARLCALDAPHGAAGAAP